MFRLIILLVISLSKMRDKIYFPVSHTIDAALAFGDFRRVIAAQPKLADSIIREKCPFEDGRFRIWQIRYADNADKHRADSSDCRSDANFWDLCYRSASEY